MFAAWSMRRAFHEEGESFHAWLTSLVSDEPEELGAAIDPANMQIKMPEIPIAGSGGGDEPEEEKPNLDCGPVGPDKHGDADEHHEAEERVPTL